MFRKYLRDKNDGYILSAVDIDLIQSVEEMEGDEGDNDTTLVLKNIQSGRGNSTARDMNNDNTRSVPIMLGHEVNADTTSYLHFATRHILATFKRRLERIVSKKNKKKAQLLSKLSDNNNKDQNKKDSQDLFKLVNLSRMNPELLMTAIDSLFGAVPTQTGYGLNNTNVYEPPEIASNPSRKRKIGGRDREDTVILPPSSTKSPPKPTKATTNNATQSIPGIEDDKLVTAQGWLFTEPRKKRSVINLFASTASLWKRNYYVLWNGQILYWFNTQMDASMFLNGASSQDNSIGKIPMSFIVAVHVSKDTKKLANKNGIELVGLNTSYIVCAENDNDFTYWLTIFSTIVQEQNLQLYNTFGDEELLKHPSELNVQKMKRSTLLALGGNVRSGSGDSNDMVVMDRRRDCLPPAARTTFSLNWD